MTGPSTALGDFCRISGGGKLGLTGADFVEDGVPAFGAGGINGYVKKVEFRRPGVVLSSIGARCGKCFFADGEWTTLANTQVILPDTTVCDPRFLWYQLNDELSWHRSGTAQPFIKPADVRGRRVYLPPIEEQRRTAEILDRADALRTKRREALAHLDALTQSTFLDMFGDPAGNRRRWPTTKLGQLTRVIRGASPRPAGDPRYFGGPIPWLKISDITASPGSRVTSIKSGVTAAGRDRSVFLSAGTLVLTNSATVGIPKILSMDACIHDGFLAFLGTDDVVTDEYLYWSFVMRRAELLSLAPEGTQKNLNTGIVKSLDVAVPPSALQRNFLRRAASIEAVAVRAGADATQLDALFASLQERAFSGQL